MAILHRPPWVTAFLQLPACRCATVQVKGFCGCRRWVTRVPTGVPTGGSTPSHRRPSASRSVKKKKKTLPLQEVDTLSLTNARGGLGKLCSVGGLRELRAEVSSCRRGEGHIYTVHGFAKCTSLWNGVSRGLIIIMANPQCFFFF